MTSQAVVVPCPLSCLPILPLARACRGAGGRAYLVGGAVRDLVLAEVGALRNEDVGVPDLDVEVHDLEPRSLERLLRKLGKVNLVGHSFAVYKVILDDTPMDVSIPRRDSKVGPGHRGIRVSGDPWMGLKEAARRRDLTLNAMALDPLTGEILDPWEGRRDIRDRILRAVDPGTFVEDPLRALRVVQFAARFEFAVDPALRTLCLSMPIEELPPERIRAEIRKLLLKARRPSWGLGLALDAGLLGRVLPPLVGLEASRVSTALDRAGALVQDRACEANEPRDEALMMTILMHSLSARDAEAVLDLLGIHRQAGFPLRRAVLFLLEHWDAIHPDLDDGTLRLLAREAEGQGDLELLISVASAIRGDPRLDSLRRRVEGLGVARSAPPRLVGGADLQEMGMRPGPSLGRILDRIYEYQLRHGIQDLDSLRPVIVSWVAEETESHDG